MVVDDSAVVRGLITRMIDAAPGLRVCASASHGAMALIELQRTPVDVVVLDIEMPVMDGLTALPQLLALRPGLKVLIASSLTRRNAEISLKALQLGAADYIGKPEGSLAAAKDFSRELVDKIRAIGARRPVAAAAALRIAQPPAPIRTARVFAVGGSTGAPPLLIKLFEQLPRTVMQPIFVTQHMPATFTAILADQIARTSGRACAEGVDGEPVQPGRIYLAPGGWHMTVVGNAAQAEIRLNQEAPENYCRPAVDPMLRSLASVYGAGVCGVILTGMGSDGARGCAAVRAAGGRFIVQDEATSVVWGMPGAAAKTGLAEGVLPFDQIAPFLARASGGPA